MRNVKYVAQRTGFINGTRVRSGETFEADSFKGSWATPVETKAGSGASAPGSIPNFDWRPITEPLKPTKKKAKKKASKKRKKTVKKSQPSSKDE